MVKADSGKNITVTQGFIDKLLDKISNILKEQYFLKEVDEEQAEEIELLLDKISSIERNFEELTKSLAKGSYPLKLARSIKVSPASAKPDIIPVAIAKSQLIDTYNEIPALLSSYINHVNLTPDSYREKNSNGIILETTIKGNYWAICTQEDKQYKYWLLPNTNISFNIHRLKTIESLFQLKGNYDLPNSDFILEEPAILSLLPDNRQWKLIQPGVLFFGNNLKPKFFQTEQLVSIDNSKQAKINEQTLSSLNSFQKTIELLTNKVTQLEIQSEIERKTYQREKQEQILVNSSVSKNNFLEDKNDRPDTTLKANQNGSYQALYHLIKAGELEVTEVQIPQGTMEKVRGDKHSELKFISDRQGSFWIINWQGVNCLIPKEKLNINLYQYGNFQRVFNCQDYQEDYVDFEVVEPAVVINCDRETWRLERKGKIKFASGNTNKIKSTKTGNNQNTNKLKANISQFRQAYAKDRKLISNLIVAKVAVSVETLEKITFYKPDNIILEKTPHGKYWIIDYLGNYFLIPSEIQHITNAKETSLTVAKLLFHLAGYYPQYSDYHLIKPAIVTKISSNQWELKEKGKFNFS